MGTVRVHLFKSSYDPFLHLLTQHNIKFKERLPPFGVPMASGSIIEILASASVLVALAKTLKAWVNSKAKRTVLITTKDKEVVHIQGYSEKQVERILQNARSISVIDASKSQEDSRGSINPSDDFDLKK